MFNSSVNFVIYCAVGSKFRQALAIKFSFLRRRNTGNSGRHTGPNSGSLPEVVQIGKGSFINHVEMVGEEGASPKVKRLESSIFRVFFFLYLTTVLFLSKLFDFPALASTSIFSARQKRNADNATSKISYFYLAMWFLRKFMKFAKNCHFNALVCSQFYGYKSKWISKGVGRKPWTRWLKVKR